MKHRHKQRMPYRCRERGLTLIELMVALLVGLLLLLMTVQIFSAIRSGQQLQSGLAAVQEDGRIALSLVAEEIRKAGFRSAVWNHPEAGYQPITANSANGTDNDTLQIMYMDSANCINPRVPSTTLHPETGEPWTQYKRVTLEVAGGNLRWRCEYGPTPDNLTVEISDQPIIDGVDSFQVLYGVDTDMPPDMSVNEWKTANEFSPHASVCLQSAFQCAAEGLMGEISNGVPVSIQIGLLVRSPENVGMDSVGQTFTVLDVQLPAFNDYVLRKLYTTTITLRNLTI